MMEQKLYRTTGESQKLLAKLEALGDAVNAAPKDKIDISVQDVKEIPVAEGTHTTLCIDCKFTCHEVCAFGDDEDKKKCIAMDGEGKCRHCKGKCDWTRHKNAMFILRCVERTEKMVPADLVKHWNEKTRTVEGALLDAMEEFLKMQKEMIEDIKELHRLTIELMGLALMHKPGALKQYINELIVTGRARGASPEQLQVLKSARNVIELMEIVKEKGIPADMQNFAEVIHILKDELLRRSKFSPENRAAEEHKPSDLYNRILDFLPKYILNTPEIPKRLPKSRPLQGPVKFKENLQAIVKLITVLLRYGKLTSLTNE